MAKVIKQSVRLVDHEGFAWVSGDFTDNQIATWYKRYKAQGIFLSVKAGA